MKVRRAKWLLAISFSGSFSSAPVVGLRTVTMRLTPQVVNIFLMATLYFCELMKGNSLPFKCRDQELTTNDPFAKYNGKTTEVYGTPYYITLKERDRIADYDLSATPSLEAQRDIFFRRFLRFNFEDSKKGITFASEKISCRN